MVAEDYRLESSILSGEIGEDIVHIYKAYLGLAVLQTLSAKVDVSEGSNL